MVDDLLTRHRIVREWVSEHYPGRFVIEVAERSKTAYQVPKNLGAGYVMTKAETEYTVEAFATDKDVTSIQLVIALLDDGSLRVVREYVYDFY